MTRLSSVLPPDGLAALLAGPRYLLPYPGAAHDELAWHLAKYLHEDALLHSEVEIEVGAEAEGGPALFTLDFVVDVPVGDAGARRRIAIEVADDRTPADHERRLRRDATLLAHGAVDTLYRLRSADVAAYTSDVLFLLAQWDADAFSARARINLRTLASPEARGVIVRPEQPTVLVPYGTPDDADALWHVANGQPPHLLVRRLDRRFPQAWRVFATPAETAAAHESPLRLVGPAPARRAA